MLLCSGPGLCLVEAADSAAQHTDCRLQGPSMGGGAPRQRCPCRPGGTRPAGRRSGPPAEHALQATCGATKAKKSASALRVPSVVTVHGILQSETPSASGVCQTAGEDRREHSCPGRLDHDGDALGSGPRAALSPFAGHRGCGALVRRVAAGPPQGTDAVEAQPRDGEAVRLADLEALLLQYPVRT